MMVSRPAGRRDIRSGSRTYGSRASAAVAAQRRALRMAARDTRLLGIGRMSQGYGGMRTGQELKGMDTSFTMSNIITTTNTNAQIQTVNLIQAGTGSWNRIGRKVTLKSLRLKGTATCSHFQDVDNDIYGNIVRIIVVWDKQPAGGTEPLFNDIFGVTSQAGVETAVFSSPPKYDTMDRFRVLKDWDMNSEPGALPSTTNYIRLDYPIDCYINLGELETTFSGQSAPMTIADINNGALYVIARAQRGDVTQTVWTLNLNARIRYLD